MASHAIVIGIDQYDPAIGKLDGAVRDALDFAAWAIGAGSVPAANLRLLLGPDPAAPPPVLPADVTGFSPVSSREIRATIEALRRALPEEGGERLYFYYAGHGASIPDWQEDPVLIPPEFRDPQLDLSTLLGFKDLFHALGELPFAEQICLIDACRDFGLEHAEPVIPSGARRRLTERKGRQYVLYSVSPGQKAAETGQGIWTRTLLDGLTGCDYRPVTRGTGRERRYEVRLDTLADWVRGEVARRIEKKFLRDAARYVQTPQYDRDKQGGDPLLATFTGETVPRAKLRVFVDPALAHATCKVSVLQYVDGLGEEIPVTASASPFRAPAQFELRPSDYSIRAEAERFAVASRGWTVQDDPLVRLTLDAMPSGPGAPQSTPLPPPPDEPPRDDFLGGPIVQETTRGSGMGTTWRGRPGSFDVSPGGFPSSGMLIVISGDSAAFIEVLDARRKVVHQAAGGFEVDLPPGIYRVRTHLPGAATSEETIEVPPGARAVYTGGAQTGVRLASLLSLAAFAAQHPETSSLADLRAIGVQRFGADPVHSGSGVLVLVGEGGDRAPEELGRFLEGCSVLLSRPGGQVVAAGGLDPLSGLGAAAQRAVDLPAIGTLSAEVRMPDRAPARYVLASLPGRLTVLVVVAEADGTVEVKQTLLPFPVRTRSMVDAGAGLRRLRIWDLAQSFYAAGDPDLALAVIGRDLEGPRLDPLLGCLAGYSLIEAVESTERFSLEVLPALLDEFFDLPDVQLLAGLLGPLEERGRRFEAALSHGLPLFSQGLHTLVEWFSETPEALAEPLASLIPGSPWTAWIARTPWPLPIG